MNNKMLPMGQSKLYAIKENDGDEEFDNYVKSLIDSMQILKFNVRLSYEKELNPVSKSKTTSTTKSSKSSN
jgi:hypothetical protein